MTLVGPGGVGKTRLAIRAASDLARGFPDGAWLVQLAELRDPALVGNAVLAALDLRDQSAAEPVALLRSYLRDKELLLVLDNCEHLLHGGRAADHDLLRAAPGVRVIATSREPLSVDGEHVLPVPPLQLPSADADEPLDRLRQNEAVQLFVERAAAASGSFELTAANQAAVVELCRRLDGLPLAIELAAVRTRVLSAEQILDRLGDRFDLLTGGSRAALPRHQTLRTTIEWSYDLLTPAERTLLTRLCVFAGRFTLDDVEAVCGWDDLPPVDALDLLSSLVDKSLVIKEDVAGAACYRLHETMREYARLKLREAGEEALVERRCTDYYLARCRQFAVEGRYRLLEWLAWVELGIDNIRAVLRRSSGPGRLPDRHRARHLPDAVLDHPRDHRGRALARRAARRGRRARRPPRGVLRPRLPGRAAERSRRPPCRRSSGACARPRGDRPQALSRSLPWPRSPPAWPATASRRGGCSTRPADRRRAGRPRRDADAAPGPGAERPPRRRPRRRRTAAARGRGSAGRRATCTAWR